MLPPRSTDRPRLAALWRLPVGLLGIEGLCAAIIYLRGFPYFGSDRIPNASLWEAPLALLHLPAIEVLSAFGLCCGFRNGTVLTHVIRGGHIPMTLTGTGLLALANWLCWLGLALLGRWVWGRRPGRPVPPPAEASA
jgi:hypothetical protein